MTIGRRSTTQCLALFCCLLGVGIGIASDHVSPATNPPEGSLWTHISDWTLNPPRNTGGQLRARIFHLQADGNFLMFQGFVNAMKPSGPYTVSEGDPITGYVGRRIRCGDGVKVVFIKHYYRPQELDRFMELALTNVRAGKIVLNGETALLRGQRFWRLASPPVAEFLKNVPSAQKVWQEHPEVRARLDAQLGNCGST